MEQPELLEPPARHFRQPVLHPPPPPRRCRWPPIPFSQDRIPCPSGRSFAQRGLISSDLLLTVCSSMVSSLYSARLRKCARTRRNQNTDASGLLPGNHARRP